MKTIKLGFLTQEDMDTTLEKSTDEEGNITYASWVKCTPVLVPNINEEATYDEDGEELTPAVYGSEVLCDILVEDDFPHEPHALEPTNPIHKFAGVN